MNISELSKMILEGKITSEELTKKALLAINENDREGKKLNSVSELSSDALFEARKRDQEIRENGLKSPLHGIPVLLKDNIDAKGMHTTAGSYALADNIAAEDSTVCAKLREAGAVILGKANLSEFAYWMSTDHMPSGYSSMSGQVVHAYNPAFDPSGSSSGSAVAVSARFVPVAIGSETCGSLMSPGIANAIVSIKPTVGLVSRKGIIPISHTQDTAGPMANSVADCAYTLQAIAGVDPTDSATLNAEVKDYVSALNTDLTGKRIGVYTDASMKTNDRITEAQEKLVKLIEEAGGTVVPVSYEKLSVPCTNILTYEFKNGLEKYLAAHSSACRSLSDIIAFNTLHKERCLVHGQDILERSNKCTGLLKEKEYWDELLSSAEESKKLIDDVMEEKELYALVSARPYAISAAAVRGTCSMVIPAMKFVAEEYTPVSYFMMACPYEEDHLIHLAYALEQGLKLENKPEWV